MAKGPGLYSDIGKNVRDLLYKDYQTDHMFALTTSTLNGMVITPTALKMGDILLADLSTQIKSKNVLTHLKVDTASNVLTTITIDEPAPGMKSIFTFAVPDQSSGKVEFQYFHENAGISTSIGLKAVPVISFSGVAGNDKLALGTDISFDTATRKFIKCNAGLNFSSSDLIASLSLNDRGDTLTGSYFHTVSPLTNTAVGAEFSHCFSSNENTLTIGIQHALDPLTNVKAKVNNYGKASAAIQHIWQQKAIVTISGEVDALAIEKSAKVGLCLILMP
ncbi:mitochondrial outer membrane protein porin of 36 kDa-like [Apium graveolens]|uniref:mitochondrial outer membrane protein porin of 36 kDa-like n=1 Tax=Apium graveolens TaxID=4045 RepID=UPI003D7BE72A